MKRLLLTTALSASIATSAVAGTNIKTSMSVQQLRSDMMVSSQSAQQSSSPMVIIILMALILIAAAASAGGSDGYHYAMYSDANLKTDIRKVGVSATGIGIFQYRYKGHPQIFEGAIAQDVQRHVPGAVAKGDGGFLTVDYSQIDVALRQLH